MGRKLCFLNGGERLYAMLLNIDTHSHTHTHSGAGSGTLRDTFVVLVSIAGLMQPGLPAVNVLRLVRVFKMVCTDMSLSLSSPALPSLTPSLERGVSCGCQAASDTLTPLAYIRIPPQLLMTVFMDVDTPGAALSAVEVTAHPDKCADVIHLASHVRICHPTAGLNHVCRRGN